MSNSRLADLYYNRYQDMLSLRKAQERLREIQKKQESEKTTIMSDDEKPKIIEKVENQLKKKTRLNQNLPSAGKSEIPKW